jgi:hypothetical protein
MDRRASAVDLMLLGTIILWALNVTVTLRREPRRAPVGVRVE